MDFIFRKCKIILQIIALHIPHQKFNQECRYPLLQNFSWCWWRFLVWTSVSYSECQYALTSYMEVYIFCAIIIATGGRKTSHWLMHIDSVEVWRKNIPLRVRPVAKFGLISFSPTCLFSALITDWWSNPRSFLPTLLLSYQDAKQMAETRHRHEPT